MLDSAGNQIGADGKVRTTENTDEYAASFILTDIADGAISFTCSASDQGMTPRAASDSVATYVDHGPQVTLKNPVPNSARPLTPALLFKFSVLPVPLSAKDKSDAVTDVSLKVNGVAIEGIAAHELEAKPGEYEVPIDLNDTKVFSPAPSGPVPVRIVATNKRGTVHTADFTFNVDSLGPVIQIISPSTPNQFVGGKVTLNFTVTDPVAGVDPATVQVLLNTVPFTFDPKNGWANPSTNSFSFTFDTKNFSANKVQLAVIIRAKDLAGNPSDGASILYYLDNTPPVVDLAPPLLQEVNRDNSTCSAKFYPLGGSPRDLDVIEDLSRFRALLWDFGNSVNSQDAFYFAGIDNSNTNTVPHLYFQTDTSKPLLKYSDSTKHGQTCDTIADETLPLTTLVPLQPTGNAFFPASAPPISGICSPGSQTTPDKAQCNGLSDLTRVISREVASGSVPAVYVIPPDGLQCTGTQYQITNIAPKDGWICAAVSAVDLTGNRAVSAPLRLCLDSAEYPGTPACAMSSVSPPSCVSDCVAPAPFAPGFIIRP